MPYNPALVERGIRDMVVWQTGELPVQLKLLSNGKSGTLVRLALRSETVKDEAKFEDELRRMLPKNYHLQLTWHNDSKVNKL